MAELLNLPLQHYSNQAGFPGGSDGKESACDAGDLGSNPGLGRSPGEGSGVQASGLESLVGSQLSD